MKASGKVANEVRLNQIKEQQEAETQKMLADFKRLPKKKLHAVRVENDPNGTVFYNSNLDQATKRAKEYERANRKYWVDAHKKNEKRFF